MSNARELAEFAAGYGSGSFAVGKNKIINGSQQIAQRGTGAVTANSGFQFATDRFFIIRDTATTAVMTAQQDSSAPVGFNNSVKVTTTTAQPSLAGTDYHRYAQNIEGFNVADLGWGTASAKTVTLSFWVRSSLTGTFGGSLGNSAWNRTYPFTYTISAADTWEQKTVTIAGDTSGTWLTDNGIGVRVDFGLGVGSTYSGTAGAWASALYISATGATNVSGTLNATWYITGVQLEEGSVATPFENRLYPQELALCQRYYAKTYDYGEVAGTNTGASYWVAGTFAQYANQTWGASWRFPVDMRAPPSVTVYTSAGTAGSLGYSHSAVSSSASVAIFGKGTKAVSAYHNATASGMTVGQGVVMYGHFVVSAEL